MGWLALVASAIGFALLYFIWPRKSRLDSHSSSSNAAPTEEAPVGQATDDVVATQAAALEDIAAATYKLAFGVARIDYQIFADHQRVIDAVRANYQRALHEPKYFPRRPAMLPKLLHALNANESTRDEIVRLILQDAVLAGNVLKRANSAFYRRHEQPVESVERAFMVLGTEGLRVPVASAVMHPVFQVPRGFFDHFAPITWEQAQCTANAAEQLARTHKSADPFVAHLLGLLTGLSRIVLFRLVLDTYREQTNLMPRAEVFIRVMLANGWDVVRMIAVAWEMSEAVIDAIDAQLATQASSQSPPSSSSLGDTLYIANLCGELALLTRHALFEETAALEIISAEASRCQLDVTAVTNVWRAALSDIET